MEICERSFELVVKHLAALNYTGPVGLSCDDTKLFSAMCLYWDAEQKSHFLVGGVDGLYHVANADQVKSVHETANIQKAAKVCYRIVLHERPTSTDLNLDHRYDFGV